MHIPSLITPAASEPFAASDMRTWVRLPEDYDGQDDLLDLAIAAGRERGEHLTGAAWVSSTWELALDEFPAGAGTIWDLGIHPVLQADDITSVKYLDTDGVEQTLDSSLYQVRITGKCQICDLLPAFGETWPDTREVSQAVKIRFSAGWAMGGLPKSLKQWLMAWAAAAYRNPEAVIAGGGGLTPVEIPIHLDSMLSGYTVLRNV